ncbi:MAG: hypothetical protein LUE11_06770 [Clostridia bacterium]|nr:hypothetical protein [Clostridia bacterium]
MSYQIGKAEFNFSLEYLDSMEDYYAGINEISAMKDFDPGVDDAVEYIRNCCEHITQFFDNVVGEGTSKAAFGERVNVKELYAAYHKFLSDTQAEQDEIIKVVNPVKADAPQLMNHEQRRATAKAQQKERKKAAIVTSDLQ